MARTAEQGAGRLARLRASFGLLGAPLLGLKLYHWLWLLLAVIGALAVAAPRVLSQPVTYVARAETRFDLRRYGPIYEPVAAGVSGLDIAINDATEALRQDRLARADVRFGRPDFRVVFTPREPGVVEARGIGPTAAEAQALANAGAEALARHVRAAGGREILRNMLGWEFWLALQPEGRPAPTPFDVLLRDILRLNAFPMSRALEPVSTPRVIADLPGEELSDLARALEARYDLWRFAINTRNATLDALCGTSGAEGTAAREQALQTCARADAAARTELIERNREIARLRAIQAALDYVLATYTARFDPDLPSAAHRVAAALPAAPEPRYVPQFLALAVFIGLALGMIGVAVDRSADLMSRAVEIWSYRELIRNLVLRDLRARYKGSVLGYLWTQLAPLGMMLVYVVVFSLLLPAGIAQFPVFLIVALLPWNYAAEAVIGGTRSIIDSAALLKKVYFPREVLPLASVCSALVNYLLSLPMMILVMALVQLTSLGRLNFAWTFAYAPVLVLIQTAMLIGMALLLSAVAVFFRDMVHLVGILVNIWFFLTPVIYPLGVFGEGLTARFVRWLNPMASLIEFYREVFYGSPVPTGFIPTPGLPALDSVLRVAVTALVFLTLGYWVFQRVSRRFGEEL
ncbi:MAG: ABC transporter permease [Chloroflexaceae bacterium]